MATLIKTLTLTLKQGAGTALHYECQLSKAELVDEPTTEEVSTFCGQDVFASPNYKLNLDGFADWGDVDGVCEIIHAAYRTDPVSEIDFVLTVGTATRTGKAKPTQDLPFGGEAGSALKFSTSLQVVGIPTEGTVTAAA